ncbi:MAG: metallophosphoesterase [Bdellovibrionales bacterium]|nr:metallophosphoesterase [Bdellovibrionales bacterium]
MIIEDIPAIKGYKSLPDFKKAAYTAIVSDLHLCEAEPVNVKYPLWKKYKTEEFFFDKEFCEFLDYIKEEAQGQQVELILNGDIFDFDSVTATPEAPTFKVSNLERHSSLLPQEEKSSFKIKRILQHHAIWLAGLRQFIKDGNRAIFVIGNHDLELHWPIVQKDILEALDLKGEEQKLVRFCEWFYISNEDTLIEHGNQYDPYCLAYDPINPFVQRFQRLQVRIPFGNVATRTLINNMGFFNPHVDSNYIMSAWEYVKFFFKYMMRSQPFLILTWLFWSMVAMVLSTFDRLTPSFKNPLTVEDKIEYIAYKANATPRMVRELKELSSSPGANFLFIVMRELWLDRAFFLLLALAIILQFFITINNVYDVSFFWMLIPMLLFLPFFLFYSRTITSDVAEYKEPREKVLWISGLISKTNRVVYGHTHDVRHELIGPIEHLNSGTWSPAFKDVECTISVDKKTFVWIQPDKKGGRRAEVLSFNLNDIKPVFSKKRSPKQV